MTDKTRPTIEPHPEDTSVDFTATATAPPGAFERLGEELARINRGFAERDQQQ
ncbi:hypothetical protein [Streptacidiphilus sp. EB103A]|uniref:hypothetical protein n=1 Tax=Streptacidiphilus sp. EB103A TaxID=3156275 RepID=UPI0035192E13